MKTKLVIFNRDSRLLIIFTVFLVLFSLKLFAQYPAGSPVAVNGKLKLVGNQLSNECGNAVQLRGMSTHGPQWFPGCYTTSSLDALVKDWGIDIFRIAMYVREGGYLNNPTYWKNWIDNMVNECGKRGIYCLIDWHILTPGDPWADMDAARDFWTYMSAKHTGKKHVLYEICNEPNGVDWNRVKSYAEDIIPRIRANDPSTIIIVGTPTWSQDVDIAANNKLNYSNIMYTLHFYAGTHTDFLRSKANTALSKGIGIFVTEFGTSQASGDGGPYLTETQKWIDWMAANKISWVNWSFADKAEVSAALNPGACGGSWNNTSQSGTFIKQRILSPADNFNCSGGTNPPPPPPSQSPYSGTPFPIPGKIEAERYDLGGRGVAYSDATAGNSGNAFRTDDVDIETTTDAGGGYNVGWTAAGEWLEYTVNVSAAGTYNFDLRVAATATGKRVRVEMDGAILGTANIPNTGGWQNWATVSLTGISLTSGQKVMRVYCETDGFNLNFIDVKSAGSTNQAPSVSITSPANNASFTAPANITISANASDADGSVSKVEFFSGTTKLGEDLTSPYSFTWSGVAAGTYSLTAKATDNAGAVTTSATVSITVTSGSTNNCPATAVPSASQFIVRNDWTDQNNGSGVTNTTDALRITHRQWGRQFLWVMQTAKNISMQAGKTYTITFSFLNDASNPVSSIDVGFSSATNWDGPVLTQPVVSAGTGWSSSSYTTKDYNYQFYLFWHSESRLQAQLAGTA
jgi:aryl-phospho-beta-D-glucosidase BglC (GH1 family)